MQVTRARLRRATGTFGMHAVRASLAGAGDDSSMHGDCCAGLAAVTHQVRAVTLDDGQRASLLLEDGRAAGLVVKGRPVALAWSTPGSDPGPAELGCARRGGSV